MTASDLKIATLAIVGLSATVAINMIALQEKRPGAATSGTPGLTQNGAIETSAIKQRSFEATVTAAINADLGPALQPGAVPLRVSPPKPSTGEPANIAEIIRGVQRELNQRGYEAGQPDGVAGLVTRAAIMAYEHDYGLPLTATASQDLLSRIVLGSSAPAPARTTGPQKVSGDAESIIRSVEQQLMTMGYTPGKVDGVGDEQMGRAIREFEADQKLPVSGRISGPLLSRLIRLQGQGTAALGASPYNAPGPANAKTAAVPPSKPAPAAKAKPAAR